MISVAIWLLITITRIPVVLFLAFWYFSHQLTMILAVIICSFLGHIAYIYLRPNYAKQSTNSFKGTKSTIQA